MATDRGNKGTHPDDQDLIALQMGGSHRGSPVEKVLISILVVVAAAVIGWFFLSGEEPAPPVEGEAIAAVSHYDMLEAWKAEKLAGTDFAELELALWDGQYCLKYVAKDETPIESVVSRYVATFCASPDECDQLTATYVPDSERAFRQHHQERTTVVAGDEILLPIPGEVTHPELATPTS